jgi:hypothetical protein
LEGQSAFAALQFKGMVDAGGCTYGTGEGEFMRNQFDKCPK